MAQDFEDLSYDKKVKELDRHIGLKLAGGVSSYSIHGRSVQHWKSDELMRLRDYYAELAAAESGGMYPVDTGLNDGEHSG